MRISVAMAVHNGLPYIREQLATILPQLGPDDELVIADDGSQDGTLDYLVELARHEPRVRLCLAPPAGPSAQPGMRPARSRTVQAFVVANFARALARCRGEIIFLSDQDDRWLPGRVAAMQAALLADPDCLLVQADARLIDASGQEIAPSFYALRHCGPGLLRNFLRNTYVGCCLAIRRELLSVALPFPARLPMHDSWLGLLAQAAGRVRFLPAILTEYRRHEQNATSLRPSPPGQVIRWRLDLLTALFGRWPAARRLRRQRWQRQARAPDH